MPHWITPFTVAIAVGFVALLLVVAAMEADEPTGEADLAARPSGDEDLEATKQPNIVVVMTDDQTVESMRVMPQVQKHIADKGVTFDNAFASNPVCCPSRATFLSGQYAHNTGVLRNTEPDGGFSAFDGAETLPVWLQRAGYYTAHIGKYLNGYGLEDPTYVPPGWSEWYGSPELGTYRMYGYTLNENGKLVTYGDYDKPDPKIYQTDVYTEKAVEFIERRARENAPFYLSMAPLAPHSEDSQPGDGDADPPTPIFPNPRPAPRHSESFGAESLPEGPSVNEADVADKPEGIRTLPLLTAPLLEVNRQRYRSRLASLLAVDDMVGRIVGTLRSTGELNDTVIMFLSDNGFLLGEHRIKGGKQLPYEESIRVPLEIRGPGFPRGEVREQLVANVDLAPTLLDLAAADAGGPIDGRSLMPLVDDEDLYSGQGVLLENWCEDNERLCYDPEDPETPRYRGVRTDRFVYLRYPNGEQEMYDLQLDPNQLDSLQSSGMYARERQALSELLDRLQFCRTRGCRIAPKLKLVLSYTPGRLGSGEPCAASAVDLTIGGKDESESVSAVFLVPSAEDVADERRGMALRIEPSELSADREMPISANVSVLDGRIATVAGSVPPAC